MKTSFARIPFRLFALAFAIILLPATGQAGAPVTLVLKPGPQEGKDLLITRGGTDTESWALFNYGVTTCLKVGQSGADENFERFLIRFDLSQVPSNAVVEAAVLQLFGLSGPPVPVAGYRLKVDWEEGSGNEEPGAANWQQRTPANDWSGAGFRGTDQGAFHSADAEIEAPLLSGTLDGSVTNRLTLDRQKVQEWVDGRFTNFGFLVRSPGETNGGFAAQLASSEHATAAWRPELSVTYRIPPAIRSVAPNSGSIGSSVVITGANFGATLAENVVYFGAVSAAVTAATRDRLTVTVPASATYAPVTVTVGGLTAFASTPFDVTFPGCFIINADSLEPKFDLVVPGHSTHVAFADLDGDGRPDLVSVEYTGNTVSIYRNLGTNGNLGAGSFAGPVSLPTGNNPYSAAFGDLDGDGQLDLAVANVSSGTVTVYRNTSEHGSLSFAAGREFPAGTTPVYVAVGDLDGDGQPDLVVADPLSDSIFVLRNNSTNGTLSFMDKAGFPAGSRPRGVALGDLDGDGRPDVAVGNYFSDTVSLFGNTSTRSSVSFAAKVDFAAGPNPSFVVLGDLDGDGRLDLAVANGHADNGGSVSVFRNTSAPGNFSLQPRVDFTAGFGPQHLALGDLDGDGKPELVLGGARGGGVYVFRNASTAGSVTSASFPETVRFPNSGADAVAIADLDGDGRADVAASTFEYGQVSIFRSAVCLTDELPCPRNIALSLSAAGGGEVRADPERAQYACREAANLSATPAPFWTFLEWRGDVAGSDTNVTISMNRSKDVQGIFGVTLSTLAIGDGTVQTDPFAALYPFGFRVRLAAVPAAGNYFAHWTNGPTGTESPRTFTVDQANAAPTAVFRPLPANHVALTLLADGRGRVQIDPPGHFFTNGASVTLTATPEAGQDFIEWSGGGSGTNPHLIVTMDQNRTMTAQFTRKPRLDVLRRSGQPREAGLLISLTGEFGQRYVVETSPNLSPPWTPLATNMATYGVAQFTEPSTNIQAQRFYRAVQAP